MIFAVISMLLMISWHCYFNRRIVVSSYLESGGLTKLPSLSFNLFQGFGTRFENRGRKNSLLKEIVVPSEVRYHIQI